MNKVINFLCLILLLLGATAQGMDRLDNQLLNAVWDRKFKEVERLIALGASVEAKDCFGNTPMIWAAREGRVAICKLLIENKASVLARDRSGHTPLMCAAYAGHEAVGRFLIDEQLKLPRQNKAAIVTFLGIVRKRSKNLPCHMHYDVAQLIARQTLQLAKWPVIEQVNHYWYNYSKDKWLAYVKQQMNSPYSTLVGSPASNANSESDTKCAKILE